MLLEKDIPSALSDRIVALYQTGYSVKDISAQCRLSVITVRARLKAAGFDTRAYRKASQSNKQKVLLLVKAGYSYAKIEELLHISTHLVREIISENGLVGFIPRTRRHVEAAAMEDAVLEDSVRELRALYFSGNYGLAKCAEITNATDEVFLWFVSHLTGEDKRLHKKNLTKNIKKLHQAGTPVTAIAKTMDISPSIVKKTL